MGTQPPTLEAAALTASQMALERSATSSVMRCCRSASTYSAASATCKCRICSVGGTPALYCESDVHMTLCNNGTDLVAAKTSPLTSMGAAVSDRRP